MMGTGLNLGMSPVGFECLMVVVVEGWGGRMTGRVNQ